MTSMFVGAAELMARALGAERFAIVVIEHPISSAAPETLAERARRAAAESVAVLRGVMR